MAAPYTTTVTLTRRDVEPDTTVVRARFVWVHVDVPGGALVEHPTTVLTPVCVTAASGTGRSILFTVDHPGVVTLESGPGEPAADLRVR